MALALGSSLKQGICAPPADRRRARCVRVNAVMADHTARVRGDANRVAYFVSNLQMWPSWYPGTTKAMKLGNGETPVAVGTKFELYQEKWGLKLPMQYEVLEMELGKKLVLSGLSEYHTQMDQFFFMADRHDLKHTSVRYVANMQLREWRAALQPVIGKLMVRGPEEAMEQLHRTLNSRQSPLASRTFEEQYQLHARGARLAQKAAATSSSRAGTTSTRGRTSRGPTQRGGPGNSPFNLRGLFTWGSTSSIDDASPISSYSDYDSAHGGHAFDSTGYGPDPSGYYTLLGLSAGAVVTQDDIKLAYRKVAMECHPDRQMGKDERSRTAAAEKYAKLMKAYETLKDPEKRRLYDSGQLMEATFSL